MYKPEMATEVAVGPETLAMKLALENGVEWRTLNDEAKQAWRRYAKATVDGRNQREKVVNDQKIINPSPCNTAWKQHKIETTEVK